MEQDFILNHLGEERSNYFNAVAPPVMQTSNFCFPDVATMREALSDELNTPFYTRGANPTVTILRQKLAALEATEDALFCASGMAAISTAVFSVLRAGDHVVCIQKPYGWTKKLFTELLSRFGVETTFVDGSPDSYRQAIKSNTRLFFLESPNSFTFEIQDLAAIAAIARPLGITTMIDNSYASPLGQQPARLGIDVVLHSASKYIGGHSDLVAGAICGSKIFIENLFKNEWMTLGGIQNPHDAWLMVRSLRTLPLRFRQSSESALKVAAFLEQHPAVDRVLHPFLPSFSQYKLAKAQMSGCGGLFSVILKTDSTKKMETFINHLKQFLLACSWGGHESLVLPVCALMPENGCPPEGLPPNLVRFYIGLESPDFLIQDLQNALNKSF